MPFQYKDTVLKQLLMSHFGTQINCFCLKGFNSRMSDSTVATTYSCLAFHGRWADFVLTPCKSSQARSGEPFGQSGPGSELRGFCSSSPFLQHQALQHSQARFLRDKMGAIIACCWGRLVSRASPNPAHPPFVCDSNVCILCFFFPHGWVVLEAVRPRSWVGYALTGLRAWMCD